MQKPKVLPIYLSYREPLEKLGVKLLKKVNGEDSNAEIQGGYELWQCALPNVWIIKKHEKNESMQNVFDENSELVMQLDIYEEHMYILPEYLIKKNLA